MNNLPRIKVSDINLEPVTEEALITTIDVFRFMHEEGSNYITVEMGGEDYEFVDEIEVYSRSLEHEVLEDIALAWISGHVEVNERNKLGGMKMEERINQLEKRVAELEGRVQEQPKEYQPKGLVYVSGRQYLNKGTPLELSVEEDERNGVTS